MGPNGMLGNFFHHCWHIVGGELIESVLAFFDSGHMLKEVNHIHLVLIPKVAHPKTIEQFRPIGLCNFIHRVIARVITNRMRKILCHIVDELQSAFVSNRLITDNILIAHELKHFLAIKKRKERLFIWP